MTLVHPRLILCTVLVLRKSTLFSWIILHRERGRISVCNTCQTPHKRVFIYVYLCKYSRVNLKIYSFRIKYGFSRKYLKISLQLS